ncbi:DNA polymerase I, partial [Patescibacteria group bacterium]|nr:DNA polymerase I [Patescibacteria group bacterium]
MASNKRKILVLIDSHAVLHRAFHALPNFTSPKGEPTGALYGFSAFLLKVIRELEPDYLAACYDLPEPTFRHIAYEKYKAKRPKMDEGLAMQINRSRDILKAFNIPVYDSSGFEADDILGTIVENLKSQISNLKIIVASGDLDTLQLVKNNDVVVYTLSKGIKEAVTYNEEAVKKRFGFSPKSTPDFKALKGDPSDNIIGVPGIGDKSASELIQKFTTIENIYKKLKKDKKALEKKGIKPRIIKLLEENEEEAMFSKTLAEIRKDAPIEFSLENSAWQDSFDIEKVKTLFQELGFRSLIERLQIAKDPPLQERFKGQVPEK